MSKTSGVWPVHCCLACSTNKADLNSDSVHPELICNKPVQCGLFCILIGVNFKWIAPRMLQNALLISKLAMTLMDTGQTQCLLPRLSCQIPLC